MFCAWYEEGVIITTVDSTLDILMEKGRFATHTLDILRPPGGGCAGYIY